MFPELIDEQIQRVAAVAKEFSRGKPEWMAIYSHFLPKTGCIF